MVLDDMGDLHVFTCLYLRCVSNFVEVIQPGYRNDPQLF